jgi:tetratricopeptide (TPR) repeat protein
MNPRDVSALFAKAVEHHQRGRLADALVAYDTILRLAPGMAAAHCNRGLVLQTMRKYPDALQSYDHAIRIEPSYADAWFNRAITLRLLNRLEDAVRNYDRVLKLKPDHAQAYGNRGNVLLALDRPTEAIASYDRALSLNPRFAEAWSNRGNALRTLGRLEEAIQDYARATDLAPGFAQAFCNRACTLRELKRPIEALQSADRAIAVKPDLAEGHLNRGNALLDLGRPDDALKSYDRAITLNPDYLEAWNNRGHALNELDRPGDAVASLDRAIALNPRFAEAWSNRGNALRDLERYEDAIESCNRAIALKPEIAEAYHNKAKALQELGRDAEALENYERALTLEPDFASAYNGKGTVFETLRRLEEALASYDEAIARNPDFADAWSNRGNVLKDMQRFGEALRSHDRAIELKADFVDAHWNKSICALLAGDFETGWPLYEWRKRKAEPQGKSFSLQSVWSGSEPLGGRILFLQGEQGLGDTIQFCRFAILAQDRGAKVILAVQDPLMRLLQNLGTEIATVPLTSVPPGFDCQAALMSLPLAFGTGGSSPVRIPYLRAENEKVEKWHDRVGANGFKIGICWQGNRQTKIDRGRSIPLRHFEALAAIPDVRLISLQKNDGVEQLSDLPRGVFVETLGDDFDAGPDAFVDAAAVMMSLDLVITSDTAIAHLAGALGRPVWLVLQHVPDWRWLLGRTDSPWYPTMRLFRQPGQGNWAGAFEEIASELRTLVQAPRVSEPSLAAT